MLLGKIAVREGDTGERDGFAFARE